MGQNVMISFSWARAHARGVGLKKPWAWHFTKTYYLPKGD